MYEIIGSLLFSLAFALWVFFDARKRENDQAIWFLGVLFLTAFVVPNYFAKRNLQKGEVRKGGTTWNVLKNFGLFWTLIVVLLFFFSSASVFNLLGTSVDNPLGLFGFLMLWGVPTIGALILGLFLKKPSEVETGPTGRLAKKKNQEQAT